MTALDIEYGPAIEPASPAPAPVHPDDCFGPKLPKPKASAKAIVATFKFRTESPRERFIQALVKRLGKPVAFEDLVAATYPEGRPEKYATDLAALDPMVAGVRWRLDMFGLGYVCSIANKKICLSPIVTGTAN